MSFFSIFYEPLPYEVDPETGLIDYDDFLKRAEMFIPKLIVVGASSYPRDFDYKRIREVISTKLATFSCCSYCSLNAFYLCEHVFLFI